MNKRPLNLYAGPFTILAIISLGLAGCAPSVVASGQQGRPTQMAMTTSAYPGPTPVNNNTQIVPPPRPTRADGKTDRFNSIWVTPLPDEKLALGNITFTSPVPIATPTPTSPRYLIQNGFEGEGLAKEFVLRVHDSQTGSEFRLGDERGGALFVVLNDQYLIWMGYHLCEGCTESMFGLYAHSFDTNTELLISDKIGGHGYAEIDGPWVIYIDIQDPLQTASNLYAHNLETGEDFLVATNAVYPYGGSMYGSPKPSDYYLIQDDKIAWVAQAPLAGKSYPWEMQVYDLTSHITTTLNIPEGLSMPQHWNIFGDMVIWQSDFWQGYDLKRDAYFTIPIVPTGWENLPVIPRDLVTAEGNNLHWSLELDGETYSFTAPIVPKGQGAQPTHLVPTPPRKPTTLPVAITPTPVPPPTAYP